MNHLELTYFRLYPNAVRVTVKDDLTGTYIYLCKDKADAENLIHHCRDRGFQKVYGELLSEEV